MTEKTDDLQENGSNVDMFFDTFLEVSLILRDCVITETTVGTAMIRENGVCWMSVIKPS